MRTKTFKCSFLFFVINLTLIITGVSFAHHLWVEKEGDRFEVKWGHPPKADPYEPNKVKEIKAFNEKGKAIKFERIDEKDKVYLSTKVDISMITLSFEGGYLVTTPDGKKKITKREAEKSGIQIIDSFYSMQYAKGIFSCGENTLKPVGLKFEIVPLKNPCEIKVNDVLPIQVYFEGKPLEGVKVETSNHTEVGKTDKDGNSSIKIAEKGVQIILAKNKVATKNDPDADYLSYTTVLTFEVK